MKLTRLTNQRPANSSRPRSIQSGHAGTIREVAGRGEDDRADGDCLQQQPRQHRDGFDVVGEAHDCDEQRRGEHRDAGSSDPRHLRKRMIAPATSSVAADHCDAGALRSWNAMG